jgi:DNA-directed RNA polymerase subunit H
MTTEIVYNNLVKLLKFRKYTNIVETDNKDNAHYLDIRATTPKGLCLVLYMFNNSATFKTLISKATKFSAFINDIEKRPIDNLIIVLEKKPLSTTINDIREFTSKGIDTYIEILHKSQFIAYYPDTYFYCLHKVVDDNYFEELKKLYHITADNIKKIYADDTAVVFAGGKIGDILQITRKSQGSGETIVYRLVERKYLLDIRDS